MLEIEIVSLLKVPINNTYRKKSLMKQTAVLWLQQAMTTHLTFEQVVSFDGLFQQALDMEKQQIMDAWMDGYDQLDAFIDKSEDYYNNHFVDANKKEYTPPRTPGHTSGITSHKKP